MPKPPLRYWMQTPPRTLDTFRADMREVMQIAKNIYAPLVSTFLDGAPQGMIADRWQVDASGKKWRFSIKKGLKFDDGTPITPQAVVANLSRILWLTKNDSLALNNLFPGNKARKSCQEPLPGLRAEADSVVFEFARRPDNLFETLEQPVYSVANPKCFSSDGTWKEPFCDGASGAYRISSVSPGKIVLQSRGVYEAVPDAPDTVEILTLSLEENVIDTLMEKRGDVVLTSRFAISRETVAEMEKRGVRMVEAPPYGMYFAQLNAGKQPFQDRALRQSVRDVFHDLLRKNSHFSDEIKLNASFIPRGGIGYRTFAAVENAKARVSRRDPVEILFFPVARFPSARDRKIQESIELSLIDALALHGLTPVVTRYTDRAPAIQRLRDGNFDAIVRFTSLLADNPYADLRMMFMSKLGALIPDPSGTVPGLIERAEASDDPEERRTLVGRINGSVYDEASIITFAHSGPVFLHNASVDLKRINLFSDPIEFRAVGWRPE